MRRLAFIVVFEKYTTANGHDVFTTHASTGVVTGSMATKHCNCPLCSKLRTMADLDVAGRAGHESTDLPFPPEEDVIL